MIILEIILFFLSIVLLSASIAGYGSILSQNTKSNFLNDVFLGYLIISLVVTFLHFFFSISFVLNIFIFIYGLLIFYKKNLNLNNLKLLKKINIFYLLILILLIPMFFSQKYHEDFGYYHLPYALAFVEEKIVFGFGNISEPFLYNSIWLNLYPLFFFDQNFSFLTLPSFLLFLSFIIFSTSKILKKKNIEISDYFLVTVLFYFLLKFTRISEFGVDFPAVIFCILAIFYFIKFYETNKYFDKKSFFFLNVAFSIFSILIKLSAIPIIILPVYIYFTNLKNFKFLIFEINFLIIYLLGIVFLVQQFVYSGCILYPTKFSCFNVNWFNPDHLNLSRKIELINKSYSVAKNIYTPEEYLNNFTWFFFWIKRNLIEIVEHLITMLIPLLVFLIFLKKREKLNLIFKEKSFLYFFCTLSLIFWFNFSPVFRFAIHIFLTLMFLISVSLFGSKTFSKKIFVIFVSFFLFFNFSKNILRIAETEKTFLGIQKIKNYYKLNDQSINKYINVYKPDNQKNKINGWQGRLCWNIPFICSYEALDVKKKNGYLIINKLKN
tara:strand:- start:823 stop:2472 length:1650 start_codon:yes stop_codon:yes gene_type:complete